MTTNKTTRFLTVATACLMAWQIAIVHAQTPPPPPPPPAPWADVRSFGAKGDGVTDDTAAIQSAINAAKGTVYFPSGIYAIKKTIQLKSATAFLGPQGGTFLPGQEHPTAGYGASLKWGTGQVLQSAKSVHRMHFARLDPLIWLLTNPSQTASAYFGNFSG